MRTYLIAAGSALLGAAAGAGITYKLVQRNFDVRYGELVSDEKAKMEAFYEKQYKVGKFATPEMAAAELLPETPIVVAVPKRELVDLDALRAYAGDFAGNIYHKPVVTENVFVRDDHPPAEVGLEIREKTFPYVISDEEFHANDDGHTQVQLSFYADGILADERDEPMAQVNMVVGDESLTMFGEKSGDPSTVYVRNENIRTDFEITKDNRKYAEIVGLG